MSKGIAALLIFIFSCGAVHATHNRAGEITYRYLGGYKYEITVLTYTFTPSLANRDSLSVNWGDGSALETVLIDKKIFLPNNIRYNTYVGVHTYPGAGTYIISMEDPNRNGGVINIPNSVNVPFYIESKLVISPFIGPNSSPVLHAPPVDNGCIGYPFIHNPTANDPDGDSLSYSLIVCKGENGKDISNYTYPTANNYLGIDPVTGDFVWDAPQVGGEFNFAILIEEWRFGVKIGYVIRDMQVYVATCSNQPPVIADVHDTCVVVGDTLTFQVNAADPNGDKVTLSAEGGPLTLSTAAAKFPEIIGNGAVTGTFTWAPDCNAVRKQPYLITFKAKDNAVPVNLFDLESVFITVIAPGPETLMVNPAGPNMVVDWSTSPCSGASGYSVYRKTGPSSFIPGPCITGIPSWTGFKKIATVPGLGNTLYLDTGLVHGINYCYRIVANFPDGAQSLASPEACNQLKRDVPVLTHVSVSHTDVSNGSIFIDWIPPLEIDTIAAPGPHRYIIFRSQGSQTSYQPLDTLPGLTDTLYLDTLINTADTCFFYKVALLNDQPGNRFIVGYSSQASSVFITKSPQDQRVVLSWSPVTPWENVLYTIYRQNPVTLVFDSIGATTEQTFVDGDLVNGNSYCYLVMSTGTYGAPNITDPLLNYSQITCAIPYDNMGPCPPDLEIGTDCLVNTLQWERPPVECGADIAGYEIWFSPDGDKPFSMVYSTSDPDDLQFVHLMAPASVVGCYKLRGIDSAGNVGPFTDVICMDSDSCDSYRIPNVFTPNGDGYNDKLIPYPYANVEKIALKMMNRWGNEVFSTEDPDILWDGHQQKTGILVSPGVYYYVCDVWFISLKGTRKTTLSGIVHVMY
jgi:gliding motility-associated-like protein